MDDKKRKLKFKVPKTSIKDSYQKEYKKETFPCEIDLENLTNPAILKNIITDQQKRLKNCFQSLVLKDRIIREQNAELDYFRRKEYRFEELTNIEQNIEFVIKDLRDELERMNIENLKLRKENLEFEINIKKMYQINNLLLKKKLSEYKDNLENILGSDHNFTELTIPKPKNFEKFRIIRDEDEDSPRIRANFLLNEQLEVLTPDPYEKHDQVSTIKKSFKKPKKKIYGYEIDELYDESSIHHPKYNIMLQYQSKT